MGHLLKLKCSHSPLNFLRILSSTSVPFTLTTVQLQNFALTHKKWITVHITTNLKTTVFLDEYLGEKVVDLWGYMDWEEKKIGPDSLLVVFSSSKVI
jgi:hypothetical protein